MQLGESCRFMIHRLGQTIETDYMHANLPFWWVCPAPQLYSKVLTGRFGVLFIGPLK